MILTRCLHAPCILSQAPRPIALITTRGPDGSFNAAPYSFFNLMGTNPPIGDTSARRLTMKSTPVKRVFVYRRCLHADGTLDTCSCC